eukprot:5622535-Alexandrium_andersonii.AAC.1
MVVVAHGWSAHRGIAGGRSAARGAQAQGCEGWQSVMGGGGCSRQSTLFNSAPILAVVKVAPMPVARVGEAKVPGPKRSNQGDATHTTSSINVSGLSNAIELLRQHATDTM